MSRLKPAAALAFAITLASAPAHAVLYSFTNEKGQYVVSQTPPEDAAIEYAVLSDEGEFIRMIRPRPLDVPITHWRPWFLPKRDEPWEGEPSTGEPVVTVDEEDSVPE